MTENKRFHFSWCCGDTGLIDEQSEDKWFIENCCSVSDLRKNWITVCDKLNEVSEENEELIKDNEQLIKENCEYKRFASKDQDLLAEFHTEIEQLKKENEQLKSELSRYKEVNRLDIWKSSYSSEDALITDLQDKCDKKQEHIVVLENKIRRMREAIHKLEWLASHRNADLKRENEQLKQRIKELEIENTAQSDAIDGLQETLTHLNLEDFE